MLRKEGLSQNNKEWLDDNFIRQKLEEAFGYSDRQLVKEFDRAAALSAQHPDPRLKPPENEFKRIMERVEREKKAERKVIRLKRVLRPLLVAALLGGAILGSGIGVSGRRAIEYGIRRQGDNGIVFNNAENANKQGNIEQAYDDIENTLGIPAVECFYMPNEMIYQDITLSKNRAKLEFIYGENHVHFYQVLWNLENSADYQSDREPYMEIYNRFLDCNILIYKSELDGEKPEFGAQFSSEKAYYYFYAIMDEEEFLKVVKYMKYHKNRL